MFYTVTAAAKIAGLNKSTVLAAIETGQITGTKDLFGEWKITDSDLHRLCVAVKEGGIRNHDPQQHASPDETNLEAEIAELVQDAGDSLRQSFDEKDHKEHEQYQQLERAQSPLTGLTPWSATSAQGGKVVVSQSWQRVIVITGGGLAAICVCWIANRSLFRQVPASIPIEKNIKSTFRVPSSENEKIGITSTENNGDTTSNAQTTRQLTTATLMSRADDSLQSANRVKPTAANPISSVPQQKSPKLAVLADQPPRKTSPRPVPVPETRPATIQGWTIREVVGDRVVLQGPNGIWKVARGDTVPGLGKVNSIVLWGKRWIVSTNKGLISTPY